MITFTLNTPITDATGASISTFICKVEEYVIRQSFGGLNSTLQLVYYRSIQDALDGFVPIVFPNSVIPSVLTNISAPLTTTQFANVDMGNVYNALLAILEDGDSAGQWQAQWGSWGGLTSYDALNAGVVDMPAVPDAAPTTLVATANGTDTIDLTWSEAATNEFGFTIERSLETGTGFVEIARVKYNVTSFSDTGLQPDTEYFYRVASYNWGGNSAYSLEDSATTAAV